MTDFFNCLGDRKHNYLRILNKSHTIKSNLGYLLFRNLPLIIGNKMKSHSKYFGEIKCYKFNKAKIIKFLRTFLL